MPFISCSRIICKKRFLKLKVLLGPNSSRQPNISAPSLPFLFPGPAGPFPLPGRSCSLDRPNSSDPASLLPLRRSSRRRTCSRGRAPPMPPRHRIPQLRHGRVRPTSPPASGPGTRPSCPVPITPYDDPPCWPFNQADSVAWNG